MTGDKPKARLLSQVGYVDNSSHARNGERADQSRRITCEVLDDYQICRNCLYLTREIQWRLWFDTMPADSSNSKRFQHFLCGEIQKPEEVFCNV